MNIMVKQVGHLGVNCYIVSCKATGEAVVIDPGDSAAEIAESLSAQALRVKYIVNTHGHSDHIGANSEIKRVTGAPLLIHQADAAMLEDAKLNLSQYIGRPILSVGADRLLKDGDTIAVGHLVFSVLHTPGHTKGGICLLVNDTLFSGDTLFAESVGRCDFPGGSMPELAQSIQTKLMALPDHVTVLPGHGPGTTIGWERAHNPYLGA